MLNPSDGSKLSADIVMDPRTVEVAASGELAYDVGPWAVVFEGEDGCTEAPGKSTIVWRKLDGEWKCVLMSFSMDAPPTRQLAHQLPVDEAVKIATDPAEAH